MKKNEWIFRMIIIISLLTLSCNLIHRLSWGDSEPPLAGKIKTKTPKTEPPVGSLEPTKESDQSIVPLSQGPLFALYESSPGETAALIQQEKILADFSNVRNPFVLSKALIDKMAADGFVVALGEDKEFFSLYEKARYDNQPIFVTSDSLLHSYHLMFDKTIRVAEEHHFIPLLAKLNEELVQKSDEVYRQLIGSPWEDAAKRNVAFFSVGSRLLDKNALVPDYCKDLVEPELSQIADASNILPSPIFPGLENGEDYTQYIPRGHYTRSEALKAYFKSMMWYGRMGFRLKGRDHEVGRKETRSALLLVHTLRNSQVDGKPALQAWADLYAPTVFFVGRSDDLTVIQYGDVMDFLYGKDASLNSIVNDQKLDEFIELAETLPPPKILGMVIQDSDDEEEVTKGLRFMGQRFVPDAYIFRQLIYRNVGTQENRRGLPKGLDLFAAMGSERAYQLLEQMGDTNYANYPSQMEKVRSWLNDLTLPEWTETLNNTWLYTFFPLIDVPGEGYPTFMRSTSWLDKQLNTVLGSWAELKHDTILYAKQVYAELGGGPPPPPPLPPRGYVEPVPEFFNRLAALTAMTRTGLESRGLLSEPDREGLGRLEDLARACQSMAEKELRGEQLTEDEYERIRYYGGELEKLVILSADMDVEGTGVGTPVEMAEDQQAAVIADVATDPDPSGTGQTAPVVLEVGVGRINELYAVVPIVDIDGNTVLQTVKGGVFSFYEFQWPASDRLTDEKWRQLLNEGTAPSEPEWTNSFFVKETSYADLANAVKTFLDGETYVFWDPAYSLENLSPSLEVFRSELESLKKSKEYVGHQLMHINFRSIDLQTPTRAIITAREKWKDSRHAYSGDYPNYDEPAVAERGPYEIDVTYTLERVTESWGTVWTVVQLQLANQIPGW